MSGNLLVRFDEGRVGRTARCRPLSYSTERPFSRLRLLSVRDMMAHAFTVIASYSSPL